MSQVQRVYCYLGQQPQLVFLVPDGCAQLGLTPGDLTQLPIQQGVSAFPGGGTACTDNTACASRSGHPYAGFILTRTAWATT